MTIVKLRYTSADLIPTLLKEETKATKKVERLHKAHQRALRKWALSVRRIATTSIRAFLTNVLSAEDPASVLAKIPTGQGMRGFTSTCDFKRAFPIPDVPSEYEFRDAQKSLERIRTRFKACSASPQEVYRFTPEAYTDFVEGRTLR